MYRDPKKRPGVVNKDEIKKLPFLADIDFELLLNKKYTPPKIELDNEIDFEKIHSVYKIYYFLLKTSQSILYYILKFNY
jgi:hypothetical protein